MTGLGDKMRARTGIARELGTFVHLTYPEADALADVIDALEAEHRKKLHPRFGVCADCEAGMCETGSALAAVARQFEDGAA